MQKLIASIQTRYEANLIIKALIPAFVKLIKDVNGSHVIQSCLTSLTVEYNKVCLFSMSFSYDELILVLGLTFILFHVLLLVFINLSYFN